jgi:hypothetical protein
MRFFAGLLLLSIVGTSVGMATFTRPLSVAKQEQDRQVLSPPQGSQTRVRSERYRRRSGIKSAFARSGRSAGRGGKLFGKNIAKGRPVRAGKELGKGMGGFGKHFGKGVARTAKRTAKP